MKFHVKQCELGLFRKGVSMDSQPITKKLLTSIDTQIKACMQAGEERPVAAAVIRCRGKHLITTSSSGAGGGLFNPGLVKGGVQKGESVLAALFREIRQELGIRRAHLRVKAYCGSYSVASLNMKRGFSRKLYFVFEVVYVGPSKLHINGELSGSFWMTLNEVEKALNLLLPQRQEKYDVLMEIFLNLKTMEENKPRVKAKKPRAKKKKASIKKSPPGHTS